MGPFNTIKGGFISYFQNVIPTNCSCNILKCHNRVFWYWWPHLFTVCETMPEFCVHAKPEPDVIMWMFLNHCRWFPPDVRFNAPSGDMFKLEEMTWCANRKLLALNTTQFSSSVICIHFGSSFQWWSGGKTDEMLWGVISREQTQTVQVFVTCSTPGPSYGAHK